MVVSGFELVNELCDETRFDKSVRGPLRRLRSFAGDGLFTAYTQEPNWSKAHNILLPAFSQHAMQGYHPMMLDIAEQLVLKWGRLNADEEIDVTRDMISLTLDTIGLCGFDYRFRRPGGDPALGLFLEAARTEEDLRPGSGPRAEGRGVADDPAGTQWSTSAATPAGWRRTSGGPSPPSTARRPERARRRRSGGWISWLKGIATWWMSGPPPKAELLRAASTTAARMLDRMCFNIPYILTF